MMRTAIEPLMDISVDELLFLYASLDGSYLAQTKEAKRLMHEVYAWHAQFPGSKEPLRHCIKTLHSLDAKMSSQGKELDEVVVEILR